jgi:hypothetical protein
MAKLEDADTAVDRIEPWLDKVRPGWVLWMQQDNSLDPIRQNPRFAALMARGLRRLRANKAETRA